MFERTLYGGNFPHISIFVTLDAYFYPDGEGPSEDIPEGEEYWVSIEDVPASCEQIWGEDLVLEREQESSILQYGVAKDWWSDFTEVRTSGDILAQDVLVDDFLPRSYYNGPTSHAYKGACGRHGRKVAVMSAARRV